MEYLLTMGDERHGPARHIRLEAEQVDASPLSIGYVRILTRGQAVSLQASALSTTALIALMIIFALISLVLLFIRTGPQRAGKRGLLAVDPSVSPGALRGYALALMDAQRFDEAEELVRAHLERTPSDSRFHALQGALIALRGNHALALAEIERALTILRRDTTKLPAYLQSYAALLLVAQAAELEALGRGADANTRMQEALTLDTGAAQWRNGVLRLLGEAARDHELERQAFERLSEWERDRAIPHAFGFADITAAVRFYRTANNQRPNDAHVLGDLAQVQHAAGDHQAAERSFQEALRISPRDPWIHYDFGSMLWRRDRLPDARRELSQAAQLAPHNAAIRGTYALLLVRMGEVPQAEQELMAALNARPDVWIVTRLYGSVLLAQQKTPQAARAYLEAERLGANDTSFRLEYADVLVQIGQPQAAEEQYRLALRKDARDGMARARYGAFLFAQLRLDEAEQQLLQSLTWPDSDQAHVTLTALYLMERRLNDALEHLQVAQEVDPSSSIVQEHRAEWLLSRGQAADAYSIAQQIIERGNARATLFLVQGSALLAKSRQLEAQAAFREAIQKDTDLPVKLLRQARVLRDRGYLNAAMETVTQALAIAPGWQDAQAAQQVLTQELAAQKAGGSGRLPERSR
ncbi:MAG: tetratricopeptide repeat protein [Ktedonobacterales bacterium]